VYQMEQQARLHKMRMSDGEDPEKLFKKLTKV
jgi:hypothetical protein